MSSLIAVRLDAGESTVPLFARFAYSADLPYAVQADFLDGLAVLASWQFDRTMLADGLRRPVGEGDVTFRPHRGSGGHELRIGLGGPAENEDGQAVLFAEARALKGFLRQTYDVVGEGEESMDLDALLDEILAR